MKMSWSLFHAVLVHTVPAWDLLSFLHLLLCLLLFFSPVLGCDSISLIDHLSSVLWAECPTDLFTCFYAPRLAKPPKGHTVSDMSFQLSSVCGWVSTPTGLCGVQNTTEQWTPQENSLLNLDPTNKVFRKGNNRTTIAGPHKPPSLRVSRYTHSNRGPITKGTIGPRLLSQRKSLWFTVAITKCWTKEGPRLLVFTHVGVCVCMQWLIMKLSKDLAYLEGLGISTQNLMCGLVFVQQSFTSAFLSDFQFSSPDSKTSSFEIWRKKLANDSALCW